MSTRLEVLKTYKLYINGSFPRTESGRYYQLKDQKGELVANICSSSRKDFRNAVLAAHKSQASWANRSAYNRAQILYRIAENLESRKEEIATLNAVENNISPAKSKKQVEAAIDRFIYFSGWADKYQQIFSSVNPVASSHFNFSMMEPSGVVAALCDQDSGFLELVSAISATIVSGNSIVILAAKLAPMSAISLGEIIHHSDVPAGVVNILTGDYEELKEHFASHMEVNALLLLGDGFDLNEIQHIAAENLKRVRHWSSEFYTSAQLESPYSIKDFLEVKTTWHPIEQIGGAQPGY